jgi:hypothetical protein
VSFVRFSAPLSKKDIADVMKMEPRLVVEWMFLPHLLVLVLPVGSVRFGNVVPNGW